MLELCVLNCSLPFATISLADASHSELQPEESVYRLPVSQTKNLRMSIKSGNSQLSGPLFDMKDGWIPHMCTFPHLDEEVSLTLGLKLSEITTENCREEELVSKQIEDLNSTLTSVQNEIIKAQLKSNINTEVSNLEDAYIDLCNKYREALDSFSLKETLLQEKIRDLSNSKIETENCLRQIKEELERTISVLDYYKSATKIEEFKTSAKSYKQLEALLEKSNTVIETQSQINLASLKQIQILEKQNQELTDKIHQRTETLSDTFYQFSFGSSLNFEETNSKMNKSVSQFGTHSRKLIRPQSANLNINIGKDTNHPGSVRKNKNPEQKYTRTTCKNKNFRSPKALK